ncbi:MAG: response regulator, partial [Proteobacteria bacterium]|nr:response regulator [Pseudomonadota bacterium]
KRDITREVRLENQLRQTQKMEAIGTLAGGIAHDFNNILSAVIGYTEIALQDAQASSELQKNLQQVLKAGGRAKDLVKQILAFSRQSELESKPVKVKSIIREALKLLRASLPSTIEIRQNLQSNSAVMADSTQIHQILMNLCTNAAQAMQEKGGILDVTLTEVQLDNEFAAQYPEIAPGTFIKLTVADTGHGIFPETQDRIFDPFFTTRGKSEGTGMGLSVVHGIVQGYKGAITVTSDPGKGSIFTIFLPVIESVVALEIQTEDPMLSGTERILFIDDEEFQVHLGQLMLERLGYNVVTETSSLKALELFRNSPEDFDLVVTDLTMPKMTGDKLGKEIIAIRNDIPIIILTGYSQKITQENVQDMGFKGFALKPIIMKDLAKIIREVLDQR